MRLKPLYTIRFFYPDGWQINLTGKKGTEEDHFYFAEGKCEGRITGKFRGSNHPHRRTDETFAMNIQGFIETDDSALIMLDYQGYGRSSDRSQELYKLIPNTNPATKFPRQVVGFAKHTTDRKISMVKRRSVRCRGGSSSPDGNTSREIETGRCQTRVQRGGSHMGITTRIAHGHASVTCFCVLGNLIENATK